MRAATTRCRHGAARGSRSGTTPSAFGATRTSSRLATDADLERLRRAARLAYRDFDAYAELERKACFYTVEPRERFVVRPLGAKGWLVSACSGHGFKLQPLITEGVAQAIAGERPAADVPAWAAGD